MGRPKSNTKFIGSNFVFIESAKKNPKCKKEYIILVQKIEEEKRLNGELENE